MDNERQSPLLRAYLLGSLEFEETLRLQRALAFGLSDGPGGALILCEHPPLITVGRQGTPADILIGPEELAARQWPPVRWAPRGGGSVLHLPGQLAIYPILRLSEFSLSVVEYMSRLQDALTAVLDDFGIRAARDRTGVWVGERLIAPVGVALRGGVSHFGAVLNVDPDLTLTRLVRSGPGEMTSIARERRGPLRHALVRQRFLEHFAVALGFGRTELLFHSPTVPGHQRLAAPSRTGSD